MYGICLTQIHYLVSVLSYLAGDIANLRALFFNFLKNKKKKTFFFGTEWRANLIDTMPSMTNKNQRQHCQPTTGRTEPARKMSNFITCFGTFLCVNLFLIACLQNAEAGVITKPEANHAPHEHKLSEKEHFGWVPVIDLAEETSGNSLASDRKWRRTGSGVGPEIPLNWAIAHEKNHIFFSILFLFLFFFFSSF